MYSDDFEGFKELEDELKEILGKTENVVDVLENGADEFTKDLLKLPKPISKIKKAGYTHLINTFSHRTIKKEVEVGWGKYYGPMVEHGTKKMDDVPHMLPLWEKNKERYYKTMIMKLGLNP